MNTVDALKKLYKTLTGSEWPYDPNPTDAEVIAKIADDANTSGGGGSDGILVLRVEDYALVSHTWDELLDIFFEFPDTLDPGARYGIGFRFEDPSKPFLSSIIWHLTDFDQNGENEIWRLYFGAGFVGMKPSVDREGASDAVGVFDMVEITKDFMADSDHLRCQLPTAESIYWNGL